MTMHPMFLRLASEELAVPRARIRRVLIALLWTAAALVLLAGCATQPNDNGAGEALGRGIREYCELPRGARELVQASLDRSVAPNRVNIICAADPLAPPPVSAPSAARVEPSQ
jgi:hypothetical protein